MGREGRAKQNAQVPDPAAPPRPGTIAVLSAALGRYTAFAQCLVALDRPAGTVIHWESSSCDIAHSRNRIVEEFVGDWLWMIDDDHVFAPDTLTRLLRHLADDRVDAVVPLCLRRFPPFRPVVLSFSEDYEAAKPAPMSGEDRGLIEIGAAGGGGMLVRRRVFEAVEPPWFAGGQIDPRLLAEDVYFCRSLRQAGCRLFCDFDLPIGHITPVAVWPSRREGFELQWIVDGVRNAKHAAVISREYAAPTGPVGSAVTRCSVVIGALTTRLGNATDAALAKAALPKAGATV